MTTGVDQDGYSPEGRVQFTVPELLRPLQATSKLIGTRYLTPYIVYGINQQSDEQLEQQAKDYVTYALNPELDLLPAR